MIAKQVYFFVLSKILLLLAVFLACNAESNLFNAFIVVVGAVGFVVLQVLVWVILPLDKKEA